MIEGRESSETSGQLEWADCGPATELSCTGSHNTETPTTRNMADILCRNGTDDGSQQRQAQGKTMSNQTQGAIPRRSRCACVSPLPSILALAGKPAVVLGGVLLSLLLHELGELPFLLEPLVPVIMDNETTGCNA